jgi:predicted PurR-regulated permease PerM
MQIAPFNDPTPRLTPLQINATVAGACGLAVCIVFVLGRIFPAILWACVLAIALWPSYVRLRNWKTGKIWQSFGAPIVFTAAIAIVVAAPIAFAVFEGIRETQSLMGWVNEARLHGAQMPSSIGQLPWLGPRASAWWQANLSNPYNAQELFRDIGPGQLVGLTRNIGPDLVHRTLLFFITVATLFFLFRDGEYLWTRVLKLAERAFGPRSSTVALHVVDAVHATVDGLVLVGFAEGLVIGIGYGIAGVPHAISFAIVTSIFAAIPFGAPIIFCLAGIFLIAGGKTLGAVGLVVFGFLVVFITDHIVRPIVIGGSARIPFLLVLIGILGGLSSLGLVGLFVGPALMAMLVAIWRELPELTAADGVCKPPPKAAG